MTLTGCADSLLGFILVTDMIIVASSDIATCIRATALQGVALSLLPIVLWGQHGQLIHVATVSVSALVIKALVIPWLLFRFLRSAHVRRESAPHVSRHAAALFATALTAIAFYLARVLVLPMAMPSTLLVPIALTTILHGLFVLISRRLAITQIIGYLTLENGVFIFGQTLVSDMPFAVELGMLLDVLGGVFVMGVAILHISREFDHVDTHQLSSLKD
jgi:hydrogenase-4 component E